MFRAVIFGGTTEGRKLCEFCADHAIPIRYCVATEEGAHPVEPLADVNIHVGRLSSDEMAALLANDNPLLMIDATHPYAVDVSNNVAAAARHLNLPLLCVARNSGEEDGCLYFKDMESLLTWLHKQSGNIFVTTGSNHAGAFTKLEDFQSRVWLRIMPSLNSLRDCLALGYRPQRLICMQGPFPEELNCAMFQAADAKILVTKNSGDIGGFCEKVRAAKSLGMVTAVLARPKEAKGSVSLDEACEKLLELKI